MHWLAVVSIGVYVASLAAAGWCAVLLASGRWARDLEVPAALLLAAGVAWGGVMVSAMATPDWSPLTMLLAYVPFWAVASWALLFARFVGRGGDARQAARSAALWTLPCLLLAPLGGVVAWGIGGLLTLVAAVFVLRRRSARQSSAATGCS